MPGWIGTLGQSFILHARLDALDLAEALRVRGGRVADLVGKPVESLAPDRLKAFLPETLAGLDRVEVSSNRQSAMGMQVAKSSAAHTMVVHSVIERLLRL